MDKLITTANGGIPVTLNDLRWSSGQESNQGIIQALNGMLVGEASDNFIVSGCVVTGSNPTKSLTAGWVVLGGELLRVDAISATLDTATNDYYEKVTTYDAAGDKTMLNGSTTQMYQKNRATITASSGNLTSTGNRIVDLVGSAWTAWPFDAGDYTSIVGTWTVASGDVASNRYKVIGKTLFWNVHLTTTTTASDIEQLVVFLPNGYISASPQMVAATMITITSGYELISGIVSSDVIGFFRSGAYPVTFPNETNTVQLFFTCAIEIL